MRHIKKSYEQDATDRNLAAIQRIDAFADSLVDASPHVSLFDFVEKDNKWDKTGIEGPLFIYHRIDKPLHSIMIANRQSLKDFIEPLHTDVKLRYQSPCVYMYKKNGAIKALSFMGEDECKRIYDVLSQICQQQSDPNNKNLVPSQASVSTLVSESSANNMRAEAEIPAPTPVDVAGSKVEPSSKTAADVRVKKPRARKPKQREDLNRNLTSIKRIDAFADSVVGTSYHVSLFEFDVAANKWNKSIFDGPLFLYKRLDKPDYSFMIANRQSPKNFIEPISKELKLRFEPPFIHFFKPTGTIRGLWFSEESECQKVFDLLCSLRGPLVEPAEIETSLVVELNQLGLASNSALNLRASADPSRQDDLKLRVDSRSDVDFGESPQSPKDSDQIDFVDDKSLSKPLSATNAQYTGVPKEGSVKSASSTKKTSAIKLEKAAALKLKRAENGKNNLETVKKIDLFADLIVGGCSHVSLYDFDVQANKWVKTDMHGPMFIYKRIDYPHHSFVIINRQSSTSHVEPMLKGVSIKFEPPYLFVFKPDGVVKALWFFNTNECRKVYECLYPLSIR